MTRQTVELIDSQGTDLTPVNAARVSMNKESDWDEKRIPDPEDSIAFDVVKVLKDKDAKLIKYLADHKHTSCFEHQTATLRLKVPIFVARQIQRHRTFAYNEVSRRYVKDELEFYVPPLRKAASNVKQGSSDELAETTVDINWYVGVAVGAYEKMLEDGVAPEQSRMILPQNLMTQFFMTGNLRNWAHFLELRLDPHSQAEVREVAQKIKDILTSLFPVSVAALLEET